MPDAKKLYQLEFSSNQDLVDYLEVTNQRYQDMDCSTNILLLPMDDREVELATHAFHARAEVFAEPWVPRA